MRVQLRFNEAIADVERNSFLGSVGITPKAPYHIALRRHLWPPALEGPLFLRPLCVHGGLLTNLALFPRCGNKNITANPSTLVAELLVNTARLKCHHFRVWLIHGPLNPSSLIQQLVITYFTI